MKVLGISFGRKLGNTEVLVKEALKVCEDSGHSIKYIRADELDIKPCTGCGSCVVGLVSGHGKGDCPIKDEMHIINEALLDCDAMIIGCPTYVLSPTGKYKVVVDRLGPSHDIAFRKAAYEEGIAAGKPADKLPDVRSFKPRVAAFISVGGAMTKNWLSFMLPTMYEFVLPIGVDVIDMYEYYKAMSFEHVVGNAPVMERAITMGRNIVASLSANSEEERLLWRGDSEGVCPVCHNDMLTILHKENKVECPVCGIEGELLLDNGTISVAFSEKEQNRSRLRFAGKQEHANEIKTCAAPRGSIPNLKELLEKYPSIG